MTKTVTSGSEWVNHYEELRANALGQRCRATGMLMFLQQGMGGWMRCLNDEDLSECRTSLCHSETPASNGIAAILADAVLETAGPVFCLKEEYNG